MKRVHGRIIAVIGVLVFAIFLVLVRRNAKPSRREELPPLVPVAQKASVPETIPIQTSHVAVPHNALNVVRAGDMTGDAKAELAKNFKEKLKPAAQKWFAAYDGHIFNGITFTMQDSKGKSKVSYLMTRKGAQALNQLPGQGFVPNLRVPVTREEVIRMVKADSGVEFKPNEVLIEPTAAACALNGGAFVHLRPAGSDPNNGLSSKIDLVFGSDGKLVNYERDPVF